MKQRSPAQSNRMPWWSKLLGGLLLAGFLGLVFESVLGQYFIFRYSQKYYELMPWLYGLLLPLLLLAWARHDAASLRHLHRANWFAYLVIIPGTLLAGASLLIFIPFGWAALAGKLMPGEAVERPAKVLTVDYAHKKFAACHQKIRIALGENSAMICVEGKLRLSLPHEGDSIKIRGYENFAGLSIGEILAAPTAVHPKQ